MKLGVIILNWHQAVDTIACVRNVRAWELPAEIWVVDNGSDDGSAARIREACPTIYLLTNTANLGFAGGNNVGMRTALEHGCDAVLLLNNDARISQTAVARLLTIMEEQQQYGAVGPSLWDMDQPQRLLSAGGDDIGLQPDSHLRRLPADDECLSVPYVPGTCLLLRASMLVEIGLLDEDYFFSGEVADLCARAWAQGYFCAIVGGARAYHEIARSENTRRHLHVYYILRNRFLYVRKFHTAQKWRLFLYWSWQSLLAWAGALRGGDWERARAVRLALADGWRGRYGAQNRRVSRGILS